MKSNDFAVALRAYADVLDAAGAREARDHILALASIFGSVPNTTVSAFIKRMKTLPSVPKQEDRQPPSLAEIARLLVPLRDLLACTTKAEFAPDVAAVELLLRERGSMRITDLVKPQAATPRGRSEKTAAPGRDDLIAEYLQRLEAHLGDEEKFAATFQALRDDSGVGKAELQAIAKQFAGSAGKSKADWLKKIWSRHQSLLTFKAKARATAGRTAA